MKLKESVWEKIGWFSMALIVLGYYLNANHHISCWVVWFIGNILMGAYCCSKKTYPPAILSFLIAVLNIYGYISWR
tara:strand:- start:2222 stop:2449 length:228 start_codon:yes stop_codon:yes gene_type:complete